jgi:hypothetical protein
LFTTTGRALRAGTAARHDVFIVVTEDPPARALDPVPLPY